MADIVSVVASTHNPRIFWNREQGNRDDLGVLNATFNQLRVMLAKSRPDVIVAVANDHLDNFFFSNMPTFAVGTGPLAEGPFWYEEEIMHLPRYKVPVDQALADHILRTGIESGIQFSQVHDFRIDHAFTLPLSFLRPEQDIPIVPIITNAFGYPLASNMRWYELGQFLKKTLGAWTAVDRVAIMGSFNLNIEVGGPKAGTFKSDFASWLLERMRQGDQDEILSTLTVPRLIEEGNSTAEFLNYVTILGVVGNLPPSLIWHQPVRGIGTCPLVFWNMA